MKKKFSAALLSAQLALFSAATAVSAQTNSALNVNIDDQQGYATNFGSLIEFVLRLVLAVGALLVFLYLILGGIEYITSGGEKGKTEAARNKITSAIVGLIILGATYALLNLALSFLGLGNLETAINQVKTINEN